MNNRKNIMRTLSLPPRTARLSLWLLLGLFATATAVQATTLYFQGNGNSTATRSWATAANWTPNPSGGGSTVNISTVAPGDDLVFGNYHNLVNSLAARPAGLPQYAKSMTFSANGYQIFSFANTNTIILGAGGMTNNVGNVTGASTDASAPAGTAFRCRIELGANATIYNGDTSFSMTLRQDNNSNNVVNCVDLKTFTLTFDGPGTNSFNTFAAGQHNGGRIDGTGGVVKNGSGQTVFNATNTYTGSTVVNAGQLVVRTWHIGGGPITVADGANLQVTVGSAGTTLPTTNLTVTSTTTNSLTIAFGSLGNPTVPVVYATNLTLNGNIYIAMTGSGLTTGTIPVIKYNGSIAGGGTPLAYALPEGVVGYLTNNVGVSTIQLVITKVPNLFWSGQTNGIAVGTWDNSTTSNWLDAASGNAPDYFDNGLSVTFNDSALSGTVTLVTNVAPFTMTVSNNSLTYTFTNNGDPLNFLRPSVGLIKDGPGVLNLNGMSNGYTGFTFIKQGKIVAGAGNAIGRGVGASGASFTNNGTLDLNGFAQNVGIMAGSGVITNGSGSPATITSQGSTADGGTWTGRFDQGPNGAITFRKSGGTLVVSNANNYSGGTRFVAGGAAATRQITLAKDNVLGTGPVVFEINSILAPGTNVAVTLSNAISIENINNGFTLGSSAANTKQLTLSGPISNGSGLDSTLTIPSDVVISGPYTSVGPNYGGMQIKDGTATLRLRSNTVAWVTSAITPAEPRVNDGALIIDGATVSVIGAVVPDFRVQQPSANLTASLYITNNGSLTVGNAAGYGRLRVGDASPSTATNIVDIRGTLTADDITMGPVSSTPSTFVTNACSEIFTNFTYSGGGKLARVNLQLGSVVTLNQFSVPSVGGTANTELNLDGATINAMEGAASSFMQGLTNVFIKNGGVTLNGANTNSIHIRQNLLTNGTGGLTWNGTNGGTLLLDGTNTYGGTTLVTAGKFGGIGRLTGPLVLASGASLYPGGGGTIGTLTISNNVTLSNVVCSFELNNTNSITVLTTNASVPCDVTNTAVRLVATNDLLVVSGTLSITNSTLIVGNDGTNLNLGDKFTLFSKPAVGFTNVNLPSLNAGLVWNNKLAVDGSIQVALAVTNLYDGNGNTGGTAPTDANSPYPSGATVTVLGNTGGLVKTGFTFSDWNTAADGSGTSYSSNATFTITANTTLFAKWMPVASAPSPTNITFSVVSGNQLVLNWPSGLGWNLETQTNSRSIGLLPATNAWTPVAPTPTPPYTNTINPTDPTVFYRLKY